MFTFIKNTLSKIYTAISLKLSTIFRSSKIDPETLKELEILLLASDAGVKTTRSIIATLQSEFEKGTLNSGQDLKKSLHKILLTILQEIPTLDLSNKKIFTFVGINGSGKTTFLGKFANIYVKQGKKVLMVAADTFRAAASDQLALWAKKNNVDIQTSLPGEDPASVVFKGCQKFISEKYDILLIDTAGRLHTKANLMLELGKITRVIAKQLPNEKITTLLTIDSMLGQNSFEQATIFKDHANVDGIILTKMDGTGKGGIVFSIAQQLKLPISFISYGEKIDDLKEFNAEEYVSELLSE